MKSVNTILSILFVVVGHVAVADYTKNTQAEDMAKITKLAAPGAGHAILKDLVGHWTSTAKFWMEGQPEQQSKGTQTNKLIMGGRFLQTDHKSTAMGQPFTGMGLVGFDNVRAEYQTVWIDTMSTSIMTSTGTYDAKTKTLSDSGTFACPITGEKNKTFRSEWKFTNKNNYTYAMFTNDKAGKEYKSMEINYTRAN